MNARALRFAALAAFVLATALTPVAYAGDKKISFTAERMSGTAAKKNGKTTLEGKASVTVGSLTITGDRIELSGKDFRYITASGSVSGNDTEKGYSFTAELLTYDRDVEVASFRGNAVLSDTKNEVESSAAIITYNQKTEVAFFQINVKLKRRTIDCSSGFALYRRSLSTLELTGAPSVTRDGDEFSADRISVDLNTERITLDGAVTGKLKDTSKSSADADKSAASGADGAASATGAPDDKKAPTTDGGKAPAATQTDAAQSGAKQNQKGTN
jgi:lipopolysaccharide export system protein LptA